MNKHTDAMLDRLLAVNWGSGRCMEYRGSRPRLMKEYLRRSALWAQALDVPKKWPWFDIAAELAPGIRPADEVLARFDRSLPPTLERWETRDATHAALHWAAMLDSGVSLPAALDDPFEPMILMFERGGGFTVELMFVDLGGIMVPRKSWRENFCAEPYSSLDIAELDAFDEAERTQDATGKQVERDS